MVCNSCGREDLSENNFCGYCGASLRNDNIHEPEQTYNNFYKNEQGMTSAQLTLPKHPQAIDANTNNKPVSFLNWLGTYGIMFIPFVGGLVFFVMLIVWSFGNNVAESKKNWARATLVFSIIMFLLAMVFIAMFIMLLRDPTFKELFYQEMELYNELYNDLSY